MVEKIIEKYSQLKGVISEYIKNGKKKEDEPTVIEAVKVIVKELSEILCEGEAKE